MQQHNPNTLADTLFWNPSDQSFRTLARKLSQSLKQNPQVNTILAPLDAKHWPLFAAEAANNNIDQLELTYLGGLNSAPLAQDKVKRLQTTEYLQNILFPDFSETSKDPLLDIVKDALLATLISGPAQVKGFASPWTRMPSTTGNVEIRRQLDLFKITPTGKQVYRGAP